MIRTHQAKANGEAARSEAGGRESWAAAVLAAPMPTMRVSSRPGISLTARMVRGLCWTTTASSAKSYTERQRDQEEEEEEEKEEKEEKEE